MQQCQVSMYGCAMDTKGKTCSLHGILAEIKKGKWKYITDHLRSIKDEDGQKEYKKKSIPCFTPSGTFQDRKVLIQHTGIIVLDIDTKDNPGLLNECSEHRQALIEDEYTHFLFSSCRGDGLAVGVKIDPAKHLKSFQYLERYYKEKHELKIDQGCNDVNRLRFISFDPHLYLNENSKTLQIAEESNELTNHDVIKKIIASGKVIGNDTYDEWVNIAFGIATEFGEAGRDYFHALSRASSKYSYEGTEEKYDHCMRTNRRAISFGTIVAYAKQAGIDINGRCSRKQDVYKKEDAISLSQEVRDWVSLCVGNFNVSDVHRELNLITKEQKHSANVELSSLCKAGTIERYGEKRGSYRLVNIDLHELKWYDVEDFAPFDIVMPFDIQKLVKIHKKGIIVVAGTSNSGKTAFMLNTIRLNVNKHKVMYFSSELSEEELAERINGFGLSKEDWNYKTNLKCYSRAIDFHDVVNPDGLNIIDFLECYEDFYKIGKHISEIHKKLKKGVAIIALQKNTNQERGLGGERGVEKARLYLTVDPGQIKIIKGKSWVNREVNPNGMHLKFKLYAGCKFIPQSGWIHPTD